MPQFELANWLPQVAWLILTFGVMYLVVRAALPKVEAVKLSRAKVISDDLGHADTAKTNAQSVEAAFQAALVAARTTATKVTGDTKTTAAADAAARLKEIDAALAAKADAAQATLAKSQAKSLKSLEAVATDVTGDMVERLTGRRPAADAAASAAAQASA